MGPPSPQPQPPPHAQDGLCFFAPWAAWLRGTGGEHSPSSWRIDDDGMEGGGDGGGAGGPAGLRFLLQFDPAKPGSFDRTLLGFSLSALFSRLLRWSKDGQRRGGSAAITVAAEGGDEDSGNAAVSAAALAAAASLCLAAMYASDHRPRPARRRRLPAAALPALTSAPRPRALPAPHDGLRILSSDPDDESPEKVLHGASIGAGDDEPDIVARVAMDAMPVPVPVANADDETETEPDRPEEEEDEEERQELQRLRELWLSLLEREQRLELRLQELEGLRSREATAVRELESRAAAADAETRLLQLKVSTLQEDNGRLRAQVEELDTARAELARAKEKLRAVKARVQGEQEAAAALLARVAELERGGEERAGALAAEVAELRKANSALEEHNMELALRLQDAEQAASASVNLVPEQEGMVEKMTYLRESNERLTRQIEQLRNDHCAHVEELVYLKWVNACLRHELLRDHDGGHPTAAEQQRHSADNRRAGSRDELSSALELSKSMSFRSSERAKQLMLRYGHPGLDGFDPALFSPLHESVDGDGYERSPAASNYYEPQRSPCATGRSGTGTAAMAAASPAAAPGKKTGPRKLKLLGNIKKLLPGGGKRSHSSGHVHGHGHSHAGRDDGRKQAAPAPRDEYLEKAMQWLSTHDVLDGDHSYESTPLSSCERTPLSSVTTNTTVDSLARDVGGGGGYSEHGETARTEAEPVLVRSKSDAGGAYGREGSRYHALRPDHPISEADEPDEFRAREKLQERRRSEELRST